MIREVFALLAFMSGVVLCIVGSVYAMGNISIIFWVGGFILVAVSVAVAFPGKTNVITGGGET